VTKPFPGNKLFINSNPIWIFLLKLGMLFSILSYLICFVLLIQMYDSWAFPYVVGSNGGAAFIIIYLLCVSIIGLPVLLAEVLIGRTAQKNPVGAFKALSDSKSSEKTCNRYHDQNHSEKIKGIQTKGKNRNTPNEIRIIAATALRGRNTPFSKPGEEGTEYLRVWLCIEM